MLPYSPLFFGQQGALRYGCYHPGSRATGVIICPPLWQEYMRSHWAMRQLATRLSESGFHVLRFDYRGSGDSSGDSLDMSLETIRDDFELAVQELRDMAGITTVSAVTLRAGFLSVYPSTTANKIIAIDGIIDGSRYIKDLEQIQHTRQSARAFPPITENELVGTIMSPSLRESVRSFRLTKPNSNTSFVFTKQNPQNAFVVEQKLTSSVITTEDNPDWSNPLQIEQAIMIPATINRVVEMVAQ